MKGRDNRFVFKMGNCPITIREMKQIFYVNEPCVLVYDNNNCVGIIFEHYESRDAVANGQAEIRFFDGFEKYYGTWHRIRINGQKLTYNTLINNLKIMPYMEYVGYIKG